jgi:putative FmdB family regulatory protein
MPLYEYECKDCSEQSEILVNNPSAKPDCPSCGSKKLVKLLSVVSAPVVSGASKGSSSSSAESGMCGRSQCASGGCMFGN